MKIIEPSVELWEQGNDWKKHLAKCARICYASEREGKEDRLIEDLKAKGHLSMFRHVSVYAIGTITESLRNTLKMYEECPYIDWIIDSDKIYIATNMNFIIDLENNQNIYYKIVLYNFIKENEVDYLQFVNTEIGILITRYTFKVTTQISTSRELNRVSPNSIAEQSTRYVYDNGTLCRPHWLNGWNISETINGKYIIYKNEDDDINHKILTYVHSCRNSFNDYNYLIRAGLNRQDARGVLPIDTATICAYTYSINEWRHILDLRYYGTTGKPHPNAKIIAGMIREELIGLGYIFK